MAALRGRGEAQPEPHAAAAGAERCILRTVVRLTDLLVGVDVGTSAVKAAVCDTAGRELCHGDARLEWRTSRSGTEIEPDQVLSAIHSALSAALSPVPDGRVAAIGVTSMAETGVLLGGKGGPVAPLIAWHDARPSATGWAPNWGRKPSR